MNVRHLDAVTYDWENLMLILPEIINGPKDRNLRRYKSRARI